MVLTSTISQLELALEGKIDFVKKTNPFGSKDEEDKEKIYWEQGGGVSDPEIAMKQIIGAIETRQNLNNRIREKPSISGGRRRRND